MSNSSAETFMRRALELSTNGFPAPNPHVGCVIAKDGQIVGEGYHDHVGGPHAEAVALQSAGERARGADVYVTLEPCAHEGRTPPCANALLAAGVSSVTVACREINPIASGGLDFLERAGVRVKAGLLEAEARKINERFLTAVERGWPFVVGKVAMSMDGRVGLPSGESKWITSEASREAGRRIRAECGAVLIGRNTVLRDEPTLTARIAGVVNQPVRIVLDPKAALTGLEKVFAPGAPTWHVVQHPIREGQIQAPMKGDLVDLRQLLKDLYARGLTGLLIEGGPITLSHFLEEGLIDRLEVFIGAKALGAGPSWLGIGVEKLSQAHQFRLEKLQQIPDDVWLTYRPLS